ncbi:MAG: hypothetical protein ABIJ09_12945 [Pseudomonadota bacterium]
MDHDGVARVCYDRRAPSDGVPVVVDKPLPFAILLRQPDQIPAVVDLLFDHPLVVSTEFGVGAPLFKATPELAQAHRTARSARERFHAYLRLGLLDEGVRVQVAARFAAQFRQRHGRGERRDIFLASGEIVRAAAQLRPLQDLDRDTRTIVVEHIRAHPHDGDALERELGRVGGPLDDADPASTDPQVYALEIKIFVDNIYNPNRRKDLAVVTALQAHPIDEPVVLECWAHPALAGYAGSLVEDMARTLQSLAVWLECEDALR